MHFIQRALPIRTDNLHAKGLLPLVQVEDKSLKEHTKYTLIYPVASVSSLSHRGTGVRRLDEKRGLFHFQIGLNKGLLKNVKFSKTDMAYLREARFFNQGANGLLQLGAVYNVELELFGNTIFYPGMEIFIDPHGS